MDGYNYGSHFYCSLFADEVLHPGLSLLENARLVLRDEPLAFYSDDRGLMTARTSWHDPDALFLWFNVRTVEGANHGIPDRGSISLTSHGLTWFEMAGYLPRTWANAGSIMVVNGVGQFPFNGLTTWSAGAVGAMAPCKVLQFAHDAIVTTAVADLSQPYEAFGCKYGLTANSRRLFRDQAFPWKDTPYSALPRCLGDCKDYPPDTSGFSCPAAATLNYTRSATLVRGEHLNTSYVLLVDDIALSDARTRSDGTQTLAAQFALPGHNMAQNDAHPNPRVYECVNETNVDRLVLSEVPACTDAVGDRRLLVKVLYSSLPVTN
jgi:hypothetical protein